MYEASQSEGADDVSVASVTRSWRIRCLCRPCRVDGRDNLSTAPNPQPHTASNTRYHEAVSLLRSPDHISRHTYCAATPRRPVQQPPPWTRRWLQCKRVWLRFRVQLPPRHDGHQRRLAQSPNPKAPGLSHHQAPRTLHTQALFGSLLPPAPTTYNASPATASWMAGRSQISRPSSISRIRRAAASPSSPAFDFATETRAEQKRTRPARPWCQHDARLLATCGL